MKTITKGNLEGEQGERASLHNTVAILQHFGHANDVGTSSDAAVNFVGTYVYAAVPPCLALAASLQTLESILNLFSIVCAGASRLRLRFTCASRSFRLLASARQRAVNDSTPTGSQGPDATPPTPNKVSSPMLQKLRSVRILAIVAESAILGEFGVWKIAKVGMAFCGETCIEKCVNFSISVRSYAR